MITLSREPDEMRGGGGGDGDLPRGRLSSHRGMEMKHTSAEWATRLNCKQLEA